MPTEQPTPVAGDTSEIGGGKPERQTTLPGARTALVLLLLINLFNYIDRFILASVAPLVQAEFFGGGEAMKSATRAAIAAGQPMLPVRAEWVIHTDPAADTKMGLLATAFLLAYMIAAPLFGWLADRWKRWLIVGIGVGIWSVASGLSGIAIGYTFLLLMRVVVGIGEAAYGPTAPTIISDMYPVKKRGAVLAWFYMAIPVGSALGYVIGGEVAAMKSWHWAFFVTVPPGIALMLWCLLMKDPPRGQAEAAVPARKATREDYRTFFRTKSYVFCTAGMAAMTFAVGGIAFWMPKYVYVFRMGGDPELDPGGLARVTTMFGAITVVTGIVATLFGGYLADVLRKRVKGAYLLVSGGAMLLCFPCFVLTLYVPFPMAWVTLGAAMFFLFMNTGPTNTVLANVTHPAVRASAFAVNIFLIHALGDAASPVIIGAIADFTGSMTAAFLPVSGMILLGGVLWLWGAQYLDRDTELAPTRLG